MCSFQSSSDFLIVFAAAAISALTSLHVCVIVPYSRLTNRPCYAILQMRWAWARRCRQYHSWRTCTWTEGSQGPALWSARSLSSLPGWLSFSDGAPSSEWSASTAAMLPSGLASAMRCTDLWMNRMSFPFRAESHILLADPEILRSVMVKLGQTQGAPALNQL